MEKYDLGRLLQESINELVETDIGLAEDLYRLIDRITKSQRRAEYPKPPCLSVDELSQSERIAGLISVLIQVATIYEHSITTKQMSHVNDLVDKIAVGYFDGSQIESGFAQELRSKNYKISARDAELALQVRISNLLDEMMPSGSWIVE